MTAKITWRRQEFEIETPISVQDALTRLHIEPETHLVMRNGELIQPNDRLEDGDVIKLIPIMIGG